MSGALMDDRPILFLPKLAKALESCERAIVVQQIHWLIMQPKSGIYADGVKWVYGTYEEWCDDYFPMWGARNLRKHISRLETEGIIISAQLRASQHDHTKYYRINYDHPTLVALRDGCTPPAPPTPESGASIRNYSSTSDGNNSSASSGKTSSRSYIEAETSSTETSKQRHKRAPSAAQPPAPADPPSAFLQEFWQTFPKVGLSAPQRKAIDAVVTDLPRWRKALNDWALAGYRPNNVKGILDWYTDPSRSTHAQQPFRGAPQSKTAASLAASDRLEARLRAEGVIA